MTIVQALASPSTGASCAFSFSEQRLLESSDWIGLDWIGLDLSWIGLSWIVLGWLAIQFFFNSAVLLEGQR